MNFIDDAGAQWAKSQPDPWTVDRLCPDCFRLLFRILKMTVILNGGELAFRVEWPGR
jgi:hypothetical protein